jgi:WD40 repeat protein
LAQFENWKENSYLALTADEQNFLDASLLERERRQTAERARQEREKALERRSIQRLRIIIAVLTGAIIVGVILMAAIFWQSQRAQRAADERLSVALATNAEQVFAEGQRELGITLALEANKIDDPPLQVQRTLANLAFAPGTRWVRPGYEGQITALDISPDGRLMVFGHGTPLETAAVSDYRLRLWEIDSGEEIRQFNQHSAAIHSAVFSPDGNTLASGGDGNELILWEVESGEQIGSYKMSVRSGVIDQIAFHPDGNSVLVQSSYLEKPFAELYLIDTNSGEVLQYIESEADDIAGIAFSPDGEHLYELSCTINQGCSLSTWEVRSGERIKIQQSFDLTELEPTSMDLSPDGEIAIIGGTQGNVVLMELGSVEFTHILEVPNVSQPTEAVALNPNGRTALAGFYSGRVCQYEISSGDEMNCFTGHTDHVWSVAISPDGRQAVSTSYDGSVRLWDLTSGNEVLRFAPQDVAGFWEIALSSDGKVAYSGAGAPYFDLPEPEGEAEGIDYVPPVENNTVILWDTESGEEISRLDGHEHSVWTIAVHPDGQQLISGARWEGLCLWDLETGDLLQYIPDNDGVTNVEYSQDGSSLLYGSWDGTLHLLDLETMNDVRSWKFQDTGGVSGLAFTIDEDAVFSGLWEGEISQWSLESGQAFHHFSGHTGPIFQIHVLPDGKRMLSFAADSTARLWDLENGEEIHTFVLDDYGAASAVTSDGQLILFSSIDVLGNATVLTLWELESREKLAQFSQDGIVWNAAFSPDGHYFYTAAWDGTVRKWLVPPQDVQELIEWVLENRYLPELSPEERARYLLESNIP